MSKQKHFLALLLPRSFLQRIPCQSLKLSLKIESAILLHIIHQKISNPQCRQLHPLHTAHRILHVMTGKFCRHLHGPPPLHVGVFKVPTLELGKLQRDGQQAP
uniref:Uncharacterized protein n=1 Tax=Micrurus spixii TaxID=129469 RepID=A0A2D4LQ12_9SAUR